MIERRKYIVQGMVVIVGLIFLVRLFGLQVLDDSYGQAANNNIVQEVVEYPFRGLIYDRNGQLITSNIPEYDLFVTPSELAVADTAEFCAMLEISVDEFDARIKAAKNYSYYKPSLFLKQISNQHFARIQDKLEDYLGLVIRARTVRSYPSSSMANALGYISEISRDELDTDEKHYYKQGDYVGKSGIEAKYESFLRGSRGKKYKIRNVRGVEKGVFQDGKYDTLAVPGENLVSTIDLDLQIYGEKLMENKAGSIVAIEPATGEILSIVSGPSYDPNLFSGKNFNANFDTISRDTLKPLFNRPLMAAYRPGSIFKIVQSLVALEEGVITKNTRLQCNTNLIGCHNGANHPFGTSETLVNAIKHSCNPYFFQVMRKVVNQNTSEDTYEDTKIGLATWSTHVASFGFGSALGVDLPGEKNGLIPTPEYYDRAYDNRPWKYSNIYSLAIGEGENLVVPLQMANFTSIVANRGFYYTPHLIKSVGKNGGPLPEYLEKHFTTVSSEHFDVAVEAMAKVVESGTGQWRAKLQGIEVCGKTGTVQNDPNPDHSVFIAFAPRNNPQIAVSVYVEDAGQGARAAAAIAGLMIEKYIKGDSARLWMEPYVLRGDFLY